MINKEQENDSLKNQDKEQIIIDGKGCRYKTWDKDCALTGDNHGDNMKPCKFIDEKNCYFKQLARKTQECEQKEKELLSNEKIINKLMKEVDELKQECVELKEQLQANQPTGICETCMAKAILQNDKYRKALEEIENFTKKHCDYWCERNKILDIINKAKGL